MSDAITRLRDFAKQMPHTADCGLLKSGEWCTCGLDQALQDFDALAQHVAGAEPERVVIPKLGIDMMVTRPDAGQAGEHPGKTWNDCNDDEKRARLREDGGRR